MADEPVKDEGICEGEACKEHAYKRFPGIWIPTSTSSFGFPSTITRRMRLHIYKNDGAEIGIMWIGRYMEDDFGGVRCRSKVCHRYSLTDTAAEVGSQGGKCGRTCTGQGHSPRSQWHSWLTQLAHICRLRHQIHYAPIILPLRSINILPCYRKRTNR